MQYQFKINLKTMMHKPRQASCLNLLPVSRWFLLLGLMVMAGGCGGSSGLESLTGRVTTADGSPLIRARVIFHAEKGRDGYSAMTDKEGRYTAGKPSGELGIASGTYKVKIVEFQRDTDHPTPPQIAFKYGILRKSGLQVTVPAEGNTFDMVLGAPK